MVIRASEEDPAPSAANYTAGASVSPSGETIGITREYLTRNGAPWLPVMGEFQFSRYPEAEWEDEILKMKAGGIQIISSYVMWIHHEEVEGVFDWAGQRDLRHFVMLCAKHGMYVYPRVGPWVHGEVRNGGLPDWVRNKSETRTNNPVYLAEVNAYLKAMAEQLRGLLWKDGGPIIGVQIENEYANSTPLGGVAHILELKRILLANGIDVPLYTVTGWDGAVVPAGQVLPVGGGYPDAPWDPSNLDLPPNETYTFQFRSHTASNMGAIGAPVAQETSAADDTPFLTAEVGGGIHVTYHRRPVVNADDVAAMLPPLLGSGANLLGYYPFHGGENPEGKLSTLNETRRTGYATDVPVKSYDFRAPISEVGLQRPSYGRLRLFNYFLNDFGSDLAPMTVHPPDRMPGSPADMTTPRIAARTREQRGFLFLNNYVRNYSMAAIKDFQVAITLPAGKQVVVPDKPVGIPSGTYLIWPFNFDIHGSLLRYSTAQLFCRMKVADTETYFFFAVPGIAPEFSFSDLDPGTLKVFGGSVEVEDKETQVRSILPGLNPAMELTKGSEKVRIVVLTRSQAEEATRVDLSDGQHLIVAPYQVFSAGHHLVVRSTSGPDFHLSVFPALPPAAASVLMRQPQDASGFVSYTASFKAVDVSVRAHQTRRATGGIDRLAPGDSSAPPPSAMDQAALWRIDTPKYARPHVSNLFLHIRYTGDLATFSRDHHLLVDNFYDGEPWTIGLQRFQPASVASHFEVAILPWRPKASILLEKSSGAAARQRTTPGITSISATPQYELVVP